MADFKIAIGPLWKHEGGKVDDKDDPGGATNMGITLATWRDQGRDLDGDGDIDKADLWKMSKADAEAIYKRAYWAPVRLDEFKSQSVANTVFDYAVNAGVKRAILVLQYALKELGQKIEIDGLIGPQTVSAANRVDAKSLFDIFQKGLGLSPAATSAKFVNGWLKRTASFKYTA
jgi:lysozyme family protein